MSAPHPKLPDAETAIPTFLAAVAKLREKEPMDDSPAINLSKLSRDIERNRLADLRALLNELTWGEMTEFATGIKAEAPAIHAWCTGNV